LPGSVEEVVEAVKKELEQKLNTQKIKGIK